MTPTVARIMKQVASDMLQYVRRNPFHLAGKDRNDREWCMEYESQVRDHELEFWENKVKYYEDQIS